MASYKGFKYLTAIHPQVTVIAASGEYAVVRSAGYKYDTLTTGTIYRVVIQRYNSGGVTPTDTTVLNNTRSAAARVPGQTWATGPAAVGNPIVVFNAGNRTSIENRWTPARPYAGIYISDAGEVGVDANTGVSNGNTVQLGWSESDPSLEGRHTRGRRVARGRGLRLFAAYKNSAFADAITQPKTNKFSIFCFDTRRNKGYNQPQDFDLLLLAGGAAPAELPRRFVSALQAVNRSSTI